MKLAKAILVAILVVGAFGCGNNDKKKDEPQEPVTDLNIVADDE